MNRNLTNSGLILPVIRKVISRDGSYVCSICRNAYSSKVDANNCLNHCWMEVQSLYPVVLRKINGRFVVFRCHFCCRDYRDESDALNCARRCQGDRNKLHVREQLLNDLPIEAPNHQRPSNLRLVALKAAPSKALAPPKPKESEPQLPEAEQPLEPLVHAEAAPKPRGKHKKEFAKHWIRQNEKYQCYTCKTLFYTKMEAQGCFDAHFDEEGYEKEPA